MRVSFSFLIPQIAMFIALFFFHFHLLSFYSVGFNSKTEVEQEGKKRGGNGV